MPDWPDDLAGASPASHSLVQSLLSSRSSRSPIRARSAVCVDSSSVGRPASIASRHLLKLVRGILTSFQVHREAVRLALEAGNQAICKRHRLHEEVGRVGSLDRPAKSITPGVRAMMWVHG